jgi:monoamine oxidase
VGGAGVDFDLAVVGGGAAGTSVADAMKRARPEWSIALFERTNRIGGRLMSVKVDGLDHPIELGGMRFLTSQPRISSMVDALGLGSHPFDTQRDRPGRTYLRGVLGAGPSDAHAGRGYDLAPDQTGRSAAALVEEAFERIVPGFHGLEHDGYVRYRATGRFLDRRVIDWPIGDAFEAVLGAEGRQFVGDAFGYDSGPRAFCAPDFVEFLNSGGDPGEEARTPDDGMDAIPRALAARFEAVGGEIRLEHELTSLQPDGGAVGLAFANDQMVRAARVVIAIPVPAVRQLTATSSALAGPAFARVLNSVEGFPAMKLYLWYARPWWRPAVPGIRSTTDLPIRKLWYFDGAPGSHSVLLGMYTDGLDVERWAGLYEGGPAGAPAPPTMLAEVHRQLRKAHPDIADIPAPIGSALMYWGADRHEIGWHFWHSGESSDEILRIAPQPDPALPVYLANEAFSRRQSWVEGALEAADAVVERITITA